MQKKNVLSGQSYMRKMRAMPFYEQGMKIPLQMLHNGVSTEELLAFTGLTDHEFARMLAGDGTYTQQQYDDLYAQIAAHGKRLAKD